jgi:tetratricopeptide (TPR) repeat protein
VNGKRYTIFLAAMLGLVITLVGPGRTGLVELAMSNSLMLRLAKGMLSSSESLDSTLISSQQVMDLSQRNPRIAWASGLYIFKKQGSYSEAYRVWNLAPAYSAESLSRVVWLLEDKSQQLSLAQLSVELDPSSINARETLAKVLVANGMWEEAKRQLDIVLLSKPNDANLYAMRGLVEYKKGGSTTKAAQLLLHAKVLDPDLIQTYLYLDSYYHEFGTLDQVAANALDGLAAAQRAQSLYRYNFDGILVDVYLRQGQLDKIAPYLETGLQYFPQGPWWNQLAGEYYAKLGQFSVAIEHYRIAAPALGNPDVFVDWGDSYRGLGDEANAMRAYCQALALRPGLTNAVQRVAVLGGKCP